jgi:hypothetical protein
MEGDGTSRDLSMREYRVLRALSDTKPLQPWRLDTGTELPEDRLGAICARLGRMGLAERVGRRAPAMWKRSPEGARLLGITEAG